VDGAQTLFRLEVFIICLHLLSITVGMTRTPEGATPDTKNKDFNLTAYVTVPDGNTSGVLAALGK